MPHIEECCVLIPVSTLEDFPSSAPRDTNHSDFDTNHPNGDAHQSDEISPVNPDATSLLAAWTVLWHPRLLASSEQLPTWYRADGPPDFTSASTANTEESLRVVTVPRLSKIMLPGDFESKCRNEDSIVWVDQITRLAMLQQLAAVPSLSDAGVGPSVNPQLGKSRQISEADFYALGYAYLQVQVMTRRLRYTSNLDEIHFQNETVSAAKAFYDHDTQSAIEAMHNAFDALAEERDHYFASDPHLVDLTLLTPSILKSFSQSRKHIESELANTNQEITNQEKQGVLLTPENLLIDESTAVAIGELDDEDRRVFDRLLKQESTSHDPMDWAGGGPSSHIALDRMTYPAAEQAIQDAFDQTTSSLGVAPSVYSRFSGTTPVDMTASVASLGVDGMIAIDFENGAGFGDEAKVIRQIGPIQLQSLTSKPIDAGDDEPFLALGPRLGEAIDSGEISTGLMVHWPDHTSESYRDVRCVASWSLVLGRFWTIGEYFRTGEQPYHHDSQSGGTGTTEHQLIDDVQRGVANPLSSIVSQTQAEIQQECEAGLQRMIWLANPNEFQGIDQQASDQRNEQTQESLAHNAVSTLGFPVVPATLNPATSTKQDQGIGESNICLINPTACPVRTTISTRTPCKLGEHIYATSNDRGNQRITVDVPAFGFANVTESSPDDRNSVSIAQRLKRTVSDALFAGNKKIAESNLLSNAFMEVAIDDQTGGIKGVYSGAIRGNRLSMQLIAMLGRKTDQPHPTAMIAKNVATKTAREDIGVIVADGQLVDETERKVAEYELTYTLERGSRLLRVDVALSGVSRFAEGADNANPWSQYIAARVAVANEAVSVRKIVRDKLHRGASRRLVAPLGLVLDEADRETLIASLGLAYHRRVQDRFIDTLLHVEKQSEQRFTLYYGFDVKGPVATARSLVTQPSIVPLDIHLKAADELPERGWLLHVAPLDVIVIGSKILTSGVDEPMLLLKLIQTKAQSTTATVELCRGVKRAMKLCLPNLTAAAFDSDENQPLEIIEDRIRVPLASHEVASVLIEMSEVA